MKQFLLICFLSFTLSVFAQTPTTQYEIYPKFPECEGVDIQASEQCFTQTLQKFLLDNFEVPETVTQKNYKGNVNVLFEVTKEGDFKVLYVDGMYEELSAEARRVFEMLPKIEPATYNGAPTYVQFTVPIAIPLNKPVYDELGNIIESKKDSNKKDLREELVNEYDDLVNLPYQNEEYTSNINIPLSHHNYSLFDPAMNRVGLNSHTAQKPYIYSEVNKYYDFAAQNASMSKTRNSWFGRKLLNEHMVTIKGKDYWITLDPGVDLQVGKDFGADLNTYNNTRLVYTQGGIGSKISFFAVVYESQGRFADYFNRYSESIRAYSYPAIIPGKGIAKGFKSDSYDYPVATGHISYTPSKYFNVQFGHGKTFLGDGYRSLLVSDNASAYPYFKLNTTFWKLKYTNTWMSLRDVREDVTDMGSYRTKYMANHYLSYNVTKRLNIGLFESVLWENDNDRGFDLNYLNPVIFYRAIEFSTGARGGNALIGLSAKYKVNDRVNVYGQFIIDEFSSLNVFSGNGSFANKTGYQVGLKYYDAFGLKNLLLQGEYNRVRPFTYSHNTVVLNYGHNNQSMAHTYGANFSEFIAIARYQRGRLYGDAKVIIAKRGFEFNTPEDSLNYGSNIYLSENDNRAYDLGNEIGQGNTTDFLHTELQLGYLINPATNLKIYGSVIFRDFNPKVNTETVFKNETTWVNFGIRTDLFNWYYDF
ncbi:gliding motility protein RemB [Aequorivita viscosa]|uniref:Protein involved in gliding motility RemB n=1 Tax=Aequorivita viscosa TaxID=797419 RepID=A0A1M6AE74_9FLAO|nr:gliding motility protein RemB [Aequorivita viscosa]SDW14724.1 protein involved in gliding motility RemB [Aequorivita viscosa]SHI34598.1 protein involved in gliding motility RemB [Aequorivita viscosa]